MVIYVLAVGYFLSCAQSHKKETQDSDTGQMDSVITEYTDAGGSAYVPRNVEEVRHMYTDTRSLVDQQGLDTTSFAYDCHGEKKGRLVYYSEAGQLRLIVHQYNEHDHYEATDQYYIKNDSLYFVFLKGTAWSFESGTVSATRDDITEKRIYLPDANPMLCLEKKYSIHSQSPKNPSSEDIDNVEVDCPSSSSLHRSYHLFAKYQNTPTSGCLE